MTTPGPPLIRLRPRVRDQTLEFFWQPPVSDGGDPITTYVLTDGGANSNDIAAPASYYLQSGLTNKIDYTFTLQASNTYGLGTAATFRTVQTGFIPPNPNFLSIYRASETSATLTWNNPVTDANTPDPWRNVVVAPVANAAGQIPYPGKNSVTSNAVRLFGNQSTATVSVAMDVSCNFIVRGMNDPGYSDAYNGTGVFSLKDVSYTDDIILSVFDLSNFYNRANYCVQKKNVGPVQNVGKSVTEYYAGASYIHNRGQCIYYTNIASGNTTFSFINKNGFLKFSTPNDMTCYAQSPTYTNPLAVTIGSTGVASSTLSVYAFDYTDFSYASTVITKSGGALYVQDLVNVWDTNAYFIVADSNTTPISYSHYTIPSGSKTPGLRYISGDSVYSFNRYNKNFFAFLYEPTNSTVAYVLKVPNSGAPTLFDISGYGIIDSNGFEFGNVSPNTVMYWGTNGSSSNLYTFNISGTPSSTIRLVSGNTGGFVQTSNTFSNFYNGFTKSAASFVDISGDGFTYAISHDVTKAPLQYFGSTINLGGITSIATSEFSGQIYYDDVLDFRFAGVAHVDGKPDGKLFTYGNAATIINASSYSPLDMKIYPKYALLFFNYSSLYPVVRLQYDATNQIFDVSGALIDSYQGTFTTISDNSGVNFFSMPWFGSYRSYMVSPTIFPPTQLADAFVSWNSTYPSGNYTIGIIDATSTFHIYNQNTLDTTGDLLFSGLYTVTKGPDCWYFYASTGSSWLISRVATNGTVIHKEFVFQNDASTWYPTAMPNGFQMQVRNSFTNNFLLIDYDTTRNTFELKAVPSIVLSITSTYPPVMQNYI